MDVTIDVPTMTTLSNIEYQNTYNVSIIATDIGRNNKNPIDTCIINNYIEQTMGYIGKKIY